MKYQDENDSYLKPGMKDESEKGHQKLKKYIVPPVSKQRPNGKRNVAPMPKNDNSSKKKALKSALGSLSSGANFLNR